MKLRRMSKGKGLYDCRRDIWWRYISDPFTSVSLRCTIRFPLFTFDEPCDKFSCRISDRACGYPKDAFVSSIHTPWIVTVIFSSHCECFASWKKIHHWRRDTTWNYFPPLQKYILKVLMWETTWRRKIFGLHLYNYFDEEWSISLISCERSFSENILLFQ